MFLLNSILNLILVFPFFVHEDVEFGLEEASGYEKAYSFGGDSKGGEKVEGVKWKDVCKVKKTCGLGVKDLKFVNLILLSKWRWIIFWDLPLIWSDNYLARYGWSGFSSPLGIRNETLGGCLNGQNVFPSLIFLLTKSQIGFPHLALRWLGTVKRPSFCMMCGVGLLLCVSLSKCCSLSWKKRLRLWVLWVLGWRMLWFGVFGGSIILIL